jgi:hypothetical protein
MFKNAFRIMTVVVVSFLIEESSSMVPWPYSPYEEYIANCRKFSRPFSAKILPDQPAIFAKSGFDFSKVMVITAHSVIRGVFKDCGVRAYFDDPIKFPAEQ